MKFRRPDLQTIFLGGVIATVAVTALYLAVFRQSGDAATAESTANAASRVETPFNGDRAYQYLVEICDIGPRVSGTEGMRRQQEMLTKHFTQLGGRVRLQKFAERHPLDGSRVELANMIVEWHPERRQRILLCAHYDTRPFPDRDKRRPRGRFIGANDGASGVALLSEMAHLMPELKSNFGVDFVLFDGEELIYNTRRDRYFLGSEHFARQYKAQPPAHRYRWGVLLDMVGDADLQIYQERNSVAWRDTRPLVKQIWGTAERLGVREFIARTKHTIRDDHLALRNIAKIPTCDVIDFDYPRPGAPSYWHTEADTPEHCSGESLGKVGWVIHEWLRTAR